MARTAGSWAKGMSGNPGGRPKILAAVQALARRHTVEAINELVHLMRAGESDHVKLAAVKLLLERGWGQPCLPIAGADGESGITVTVLKLTEPEEGRTPLPEPRPQPQPQRANGDQFVDFNDVDPRELRGGKNIHVTGARSR
jgi:hypothetical protein